MRYLLAILAASAVVGTGCPHSAPDPVTPVPTDPTCGLSVPEHDDLVDTIVNDLSGTDVNLTVERARYSTRTVGCVVDEIIGDVHEAPELIDAATKWRQANP